MFTYNEKNQWWWCGWKGILAHCRQECKLVQPLGKTEGRFLKRLRLGLPWKVKVLVAQSCLTVCDPMGLPGSSVHGILQTKNTGVGSYSLLQGIFPTQGSNPGHLHCKQILYHLCAIWVSNSASVYLSRAKKNVIGNNIRTPMFIGSVIHDSQDMGTS